MFKNILFLFLISFSLLPTITQASPQNGESITFFSSYIKINQDASIDIVENISVNAEGLQIKRGIIRSLPMQYKDSYGVSHNPYYDVKDISLDRLPTPYRTENRNNQFSIIIGDKDVILAPGNYTYTISYHVPDAINFLKDGDELYWNITGNAWTFPIAEANAIIQLPKGAKVSSYAAYTGAMGAKDKDFAVSQPSEDQIIFTTTKALPPGSGLTIAVAWPKGFVTAPTLLNEINPALYLMTAIGFGIFIYYFLTWRRHGIDPKKGTIIPRFEVPENLSPAAMRYIFEMGVDAKTFTTAIISMATKGFLTIKNVNDVFTLQKNNKNTVTLAPEEEAVSETLFPGSTTSLTVNQSNQKTIEAAQKAMFKRLLSTYKTTYFRTNVKYFWTGVLLSCIAFAVAILSSPKTGDAFFAVVWLSGWIFGTTFLVISALKALKSVFSYFTFTAFLRAIPHTFLALVFLGAALFGFFALGDALPLFFMPVLLIIVLMNLIFYFLLKAPTPAGRQLMDEIEGFKLFLGTTERYRLEKFHPPAQTPETFEKYLPYAIALDVENQWGENFNALLEEAGIPPSDYHPGWYRGDSWTVASAAQFPARLNGGLLAAVAAASISSVSVSSSASGGGGSSGGGGGGGGGSGW